MTARLRRFSATEIDDWISDPYSIYAKRILNLRLPDDIDRAPDAALRGNIVHDVLAAFVKEYSEGPLPDDALSQLRQFAEHFLNHLADPQWRVFWWPAFELLSWAVC